MVYFANGGAITGRLMRILGADILIAGLLALNLGERGSDPVILSAARNLFDRLTLSLNLAR